MKAMECEQCRDERKRRARERTRGDRRHLSEPFVSAPYIRFYNQPKYHALQLRALRFARAHSRRVRWVQARDKPLAKEDKAASREALAHKRNQWLQKHDQDTAGIPGLFPAVRGMPIRFTATVDREKQIFKHTRGVLKGWELERVDQERLRQYTEQEFVCDLMPKYFFVRVASTEWTIKKSWGKGVYVCGANVRRRHP